MSRPALVEEPYRRSAQAVLAALGSDARLGLSEAEADRRLTAYGRNELAAPPARPEWVKLVSQLGDVLVLLLIAAAAVSAVVWWLERETALPYEALAIFAIVVLNALLGYFQEARAERAAAALKQLSATQSSVQRDGVRRRMAAATLVPGDLIWVEEGDTIPADARLIESASLQTVESALTGESTPVSKDVEPLSEAAELGDQRSMLFSGTTAVYGHGRAVVTATGMRTMMGRIAGMLAQQPEEATPLQRELGRVGRLLAIIVVLIAAAMIGTLFLVDHVRTFAAAFDVLILGVALAVAAVPEGLPAVVTAVLSLGTQRMAKSHAIIRRLSAVETLGSATVIASDKTGTLTRNEMTVRRVVTASGHADFTGTGYVPQGDVRLTPAGEPASLQVELERALTVAECASNAALVRRDDGWSVQGDPTEGALLVAARKAGLMPEALARRLPRIAEVPFSSERKRMSTLHEDAQSPGHLLLMSKGAADVLLARCTRELLGGEPVALTEERRAAILARNEAMAGQALRTLGVAFRWMPREPAHAFDSGAVDARALGGKAIEEKETELVFIGLIGMIDPPRPEAQAAVARAQGAGIRCLLITGDHPATAAVIAAELGIAREGRVVTGTALEAMSEAELDRTVREVSVYARVNPAHKLRIVKALQRGGETVAMTGDGVNDAPALKAADIGIAMGITGTDVSREAADMVLADDNFATIVAAVEEGRSIFTNIRKFLRYLLSSNIGEVMAMFFGVLFASRIGLTAAPGTLALPLLATQILWINLVTDGAPALALGLDPPDENVMGRRPRRQGEGVITRHMWGGILLLGAVMAAGTLLVLDASLPGGLIPGTGTLTYARTMAFTTLVMFQLFNVFNARSDEESALRRPFRNHWLLIALAASLAVHALVLYTPALQKAFSTVGLTAGDWLLCTAVASSVLWVRELSKLAHRAYIRLRGPARSFG